MHAGRAGTGGDPQARLIRIDDKSEVGDRIDQRLGRVRVEAPDQERPPWRQSNTFCAKRPGVFEQRLETIRFDFTKGSRRADDNRRAIRVRAERFA